MDAYTAALNSIGDSMIEWSDPEGKFSGYTKVRGIITELISTMLLEGEKDSKGLVRLIEFRKISKLTNNSFLSLH